MGNRRWIAVATLCLGMGFAMPTLGAQQATPDQTPPTDQSGQVTNPQPHTDQEYHNEKKHEKKELKHNKKADKAARKAAEHESKAEKEQDKAAREADKANSEAAKPN